MGVSVSDRSIESWGDHFFWWKNGTHLVQSSWDSPQPPFYQCNETGKILDIMSRNPPVGDRKVPRKWSLKSWIYHHYILFCWGLPCYHKPTGGIFFPMAFPKNGKSQVVTLLRWRVVELYYREVDELLYELSDLVGGWMDRWMDGWMDCTVPSGKHTKSYWTWPFIVSFPIENGDFP